MELCYYFLNNPDELYDILHHWFIFILDKQDRLFTSYEDNYGKYPEPVTESGLGINIVIIDQIRLVV